MGEVGKGAGMARDTQSGAHVFCQLFSSAPLAIVL